MTPPLPGKLQELHPLGDQMYIYLSALTQSSPRPCGRGGVLYFYLYQIRHFPVKENLSKYGCPHYARYLNILNGKLSGAELACCHRVSARTYLL